MVAVYLLFIIFASLTYMSIRARIVVAVALHEIDYAPDTKPGSKCYNKGLQNVYCAIEKCHVKSFLPRLRLSGKRTKGGQRMVAAA